MDRKLKLGVACDFLTERQRDEIRTEAERLGVSVTIFEDEEAAKGHVADLDILFSRSPKLAPEVRDLKWIASSNAGIESYLQPGVLKPDTLLTNNAGSYGITISEHVVMVTLMLLRKTMMYVRSELEGRWDGRHPEFRSIRGSRVTIVGTGDIGLNVAKRMRALEADRIAGYSRTGRKKEFFDETHPIGELDAILPDTDILVMCVPNTPDTQKILSAERIARLPEQAVVINVGRGASVDQAALCEALKAGSIAGAALDVFEKEPIPEDDPVWTAPNLILTPHISGNMSLGITTDLTVKKFLTNLQKFVGGESLDNVVDRARGY